MFSTNFKKIGCRFAESKFLKKIQDVRYGHVVNQLLP